nr:UNC93-like protein 3 [Ipomoea trifida]
MAIDVESESPLVGDYQNHQRGSVNHERDVHILSCAFLLIFLAYGAAQNLESTINTEADLGTISLGVLYLSFTVFSIVASLVVRKIGSKNALLLGTTGYWLFIAANLKPSWYTMIPASLYLGFAAAIIWVGQGTYLTSTAESHASDHNLHEGTVIGKFNGEFWGIFASHQVVGNLITLALLRDGTGGGTGDTTVLFIVFLCSMTLGTILMCFLSRRNAKEEASPQHSSVSFLSSVVSSSKSIISLLLDIRMLLVVPLIAYSGLQQAFVWAEFTKYLVQPKMGESGVGGAMAIYGLFDAICSLAAGRFTFGLKSITMIVSGGGIIQAVVLLWILLNHSVDYGIVGILVIAGLWGIGDGVLNTQLSALLGILYKHDLEGAFSQLKLWQSFTIALVFFFSPLISLKVMLVIMFAALCISMVAVLFLMLKVEKAFSDPDSL